jgi:hypothetical protein
VPQGLRRIRDAGQPHRLAERRARRVYVSPTGTKCSVQPMAYSETGSKKGAPSLGEEKERRGQCSKLVSIKGAEKAVIFRFPS